MTIGLGHYLAVGAILFTVGILGIFHQRRQQHVGVEEINAHGSVDHGRIEGRAQVGGLGLFLETDHFASAAYFHHPEAGHFIRTNRQRSQGYVGAGIVVVLEHQPVVHFVNVVAGENEHMLRLLRADGVDVLVNRIRGTHIPIGADPLHRRQDLNKLAQFLGDNTGPALADMAVERERLVLGEDVDPAQVGVDAV